MLIKFNYISSIKIQQKCQIFIHANVTLIKCKINENVRTKISYPFLYEYGKSQTRWIQASMQVVVVFKNLYFKKTTKNYKFN